MTRKRELPVYVSLEEAAEIMSLSTRTIRPDQRRHHPRLPVRQASHPHPPRRARSRITPHPVRTLVRTSQRRCPIIAERFGANTRRPASRCISPRMGRQPGKCRHCLCPNSDTNVTPPARIRIGLRKPPATSTEVLGPMESPQATQPRDRLSPFALPSCCALDSARSEIEGVEVQIGNCNYMERAG
jgi:hypothetical protein